MAEDFKKLKEDAVRQVIKKGISRFLESVVMLGVGVCAGYLLAVIHYDSERARPNLSLRVSEKADVNGDGMTTGKEWAQVYKTLGIPFDIYSQNPGEDLSNRQMIKYLTK